MAHQGKDIKLDEGAWNEQSPFDGKRHRDGAYDWVKWLRQLLALYET